jgi:arachidonate 15-lipoxygenase
MRPTLPQYDTAREARAPQLERSRETYRYDYSWPDGVATAAELPKADGYGLVYTAHAAAVYARIGANLARMAAEDFSVADLEHALKSRFEEAEIEGPGKLLFTLPREIAQSMKRRRPKSWRDFSQLFQVWQTPDIAAAYAGTDEDRDLAFAWQRVAGVNPMVLARCSKIPDNFPVTSAMFARAMAGDSLEAAAREGRLYLADYALLDGVATGTTDGIDKFLAAPLALFAVDSAGRLRPIAIQCGQVPDAAHPIFTPADGWRWRMAQTTVQTADANHHEGVAHLARTHMVMEATKLALERQLAQNHPLYSLLWVHCETTLAINESAKTSLIAPGGTVDRCFAPKIEAFCSIVHGAVQSHSIRDATPAIDLAARGLDDPAALPQHPYRDDSALVWAAVERFVGEYVGLYYLEDADVRDDTELRAFATELGAVDGGRLADVPVPETIADVVGLVTRLVFTAGPAHSAVNFPQFPFMGFVPNMPGAAYQPAPGPDTPDTEDELTARMPGWDIAVEDTTMIYLLSETRISRLGDYAPLAFRDLRVFPVVERFKSELRDVEAAIDAREPTRLYRYPFLKPSNILQSISI